MAPKNKGSEDHARTLMREVARNIASRIKQSIFGRLSGSTERRKLRC
jgi:hypothetical protein